MKVLLQTQQRKVYYYSRSKRVRERNVSFLVSPVSMLVLDFVGGVSL